MPNLIRSSGIWASARLEGRSNTVPDRYDLVQLMCDQYDGFSLVLQAPDRREKLLDLLGSQNGGWFVENQKLRLAVQDLENLHALLHPHRERFYSCPEIDVNAVGL